MNSYLAWVTTGFSDEVLTDDKNHWHDKETSLRLKEFKLEWKIRLCSWLSFIQIFIEHLLCVSHCEKHSSYSDHKDIISVVRLLPV